MKRWFGRRRAAGVLLVLAALLASPALTQDARADPSCPDGQPPQFGPDFAVLKARTAQDGDPMGYPLECEQPFADRGDMLQHTSTGLAFLRKTTNVPTFTDGYNHWGLGASGMLAWTGSSLDPPGVPAPPAAAAAPSLMLAEVVSLPPTPAAPGVWTRVASGAATAVSAPRYPDDNRLFRLVPRLTDPAMPAPTPVPPSPTAAGVGTPSPAAGSAVPKPELTAGALATPGATPGPATLVLGEPVAAAAARSTVVPVPEDFRLQLSVTQGRTWQEVSNMEACNGASPPFGQPALLLSPTFQSDQTMLAVTSAQGATSVINHACLSRDAGRTWTELRGYPPAAKRLTYAFSPTFAVDHRLWGWGADDVAEPEAGTETDQSTAFLVASNDGGQSWRRLPGPPRPGAAEIRSLALSGSANGQTTLLLTANDPARDPGARFFRSTDEGATWQEITEVFRDPVTGSLPSALSFLAGADPRRVYAAAAGPDVAAALLRNAGPTATGAPVGPGPTGTWASSDAGAAWQKSAADAATAVTANGCAVLLSASDVTLLCGGAAPITSSPSSRPLTAVRSAESFGAGGAVLVVVDDGLSQYHFSP